MSEKFDRSDMKLQGSTETIIDFFEFAIYCILYQRKVYNQESFSFVKKFNVSLVISIDPEVTKYVKKILLQCKDWMTRSDISTLVLVIVDGTKVLERWQFDIEYQNKEIQDAQKQIQQIIRQITCSVGFLPVFEEQVSFTVLAYTSKDAIVTEEWLDSDAKMIANPELVKLSDLDTGVHKVGGMVQYKVE
jgi:mitotic spindle assembly checkpoint protein MAD2